MGRSVARQGGREERGFMAPMLRLYNTLTGQKDAFRPIDPGNVRLYACGPTVYDAAHIGNARPIIVFDLLFRLLRHLYGPAHVTYARNVTDVDDKITPARAAERGITIRELTDGTLAQFHKDVRDLGILMPEDVNRPGEPPRFIEPRATDHIAEMTAMIEGLVAAGHAYVADGHVLFDVPSMPDYGRLSKRPPRRDGGRRPRRGRALQALAPRFRAVEAVEAGRALVALALRDRGAGAAGLAHRVLGHVGQAPRPDLRHPCRRDRPDLPPPRERGGAVALLLRHAGHGQRVDAQRLPAGRGGEDVEVPRQLHHHPAGAGRLAGRGRAPQHAEDALPPADRLDPARAGGIQPDAGPLVRHGRRCGRGAGAAERASSRRSSTT